MNAYGKLSSDELRVELAQQRSHHAALAQRGLKLNMARGKPSPEQLDLSLPLLDMLPAAGCAEPLHAGAADDLRNYGGIGGIAEARMLMGSVLDVPASSVLVHGNSSLSLMYSLVSLAMTHGVLGSAPWATLDEPPRFLCPVPGYDRHFAICEHFGIEMVCVPLGKLGPDMDAVEALVGVDARVKGIWCVPRFSNPTGIVYSDETVRRLAALKPAAPDFRIYWDNAYAVHELASAQDREAANTALLNLASVCERAGTSNLWYQFASTSKITFAGGGVAALASSEDNLKSIRAAFAYQTIGPNKLNQKRHVLFLPDLKAVRAHMRRHAELLTPKFELVQRVLAEGLANTGVGSWTRPQGGYFISFDGLPHTARRTVELAAEAGVVLTPAGATYPYGNDPADTNIRIAPSYPSLDELGEATAIFVVCARIAALEQLLAER
jgi:DNA-binding transcriptional MocR family regulator